MLLLIANVVIIMSVTVAVLNAAAATEFIGGKLADVAATITHHEDTEALQNQVGKSSRQMSRASCQTPRVVTCI